MLKRYLVIVGIVFAVVVGGGIWLKPSAEKIRDSVEAGLSAFARARTAAGQVVPEVAHRETKDWVIATSHTAVVGEYEFFCIGGFRITYCSVPDAE